MRLGDRAIDPPVLRAPMPELTDRPLRALVARWGSEPIVSEMLAGRAPLVRPPWALARAEVAAGADSNGVGTAVLIGSDPQATAEAARRLAGDGADIEIAISCAGRTARKHLDGHLAQVPGTAPLLARLIREDHPRRLPAGVAEPGRPDATVPPDPPAWAT